MKRISPRQVLITTGLFTLLAIKLLSGYFSLFLLNSSLDHIITSLIVVFMILLLISLTTPHLKDHRMRNLFQNILFLGGAVVIFFIFQNELLAVGISLGILAAILTIVFQAPLLSFVGWVYLSASGIYAEGDRIRIDDIKGDVISINPLRTKVLEVGGEYMNSDLMSGRIYTFPNSLVLSKAVSNYTEEFPYIWMDIPFQFSYETDFTFLVTEIDKIIAKALQLNSEKMEKSYNKLLRKYNLKREERLKGRYNISPTNQGWIEFRVTFPVDPHNQFNFSGVITKEILDLCNAHPDKAQFPIGRSR